ADATGTVLRSRTLSPSPGGPTCCVGKTCMKVKRTSVVLKPDCSRVFFRPFESMSRERVSRVLARVLALEEAEAEREMRWILRDFVDRHQKLREFLVHRYEQVRDNVPTDAPLSENRRLLIGAYLTQEYSLEAAAL